MADRAALPVVCVLDVPDECRSEDRQKLVSSLCGTYQQLLKAQPTATLKFLITSRPCDVMQRWFEHSVSGFPYARLRGEDESVRIQNEVALVIDQQVDNLAAQYGLLRQNQDRWRQRLRHMEHRTHLSLYIMMVEIRRAHHDLITLSDIKVNHFFLIGRRCVW